ncbi:MAG: hypothetical protein EA376_12590 [Phycisphaeraceae bacterium]|nr:MAG: hypothetical protein EA376_12590 [Phycisphaeraceae bacterium]
MSGTDFAIVMFLCFAIIPVVFLILSHISGWRRLARRYPSCDSTELARTRFGSIAIRSPWMRYNNCIRYTTDERCLHIRLIPPFGLFFHPPMSIPWERIELPESVRRPARVSWTPIQVDGVAIWLPGIVVADEISLRAGHGEPAGANFPDDNTPEVA